MIAKQLRVGQDIPRQGFSQALVQTRMNRGRNEGGEKSRKVIAQEWRTKDQIPAAPITEGLNSHLPTAIPDAGISGIQKLLFPTVTIFNPSIDSSCSLAPR